MTPPSVNNQQLILDSCIVEYLLDRYIKDELQSQLQEWANAHADLAVSEISYTELIAGAYKDKISLIKETLEPYTKLKLTQRVLSGAGIINNIYRTKYKDFRDVGIADQVIAATACIYNLPIITANVLDFPHPFFTSIDSANISYKKKNSTHYLAVDILKPNLSLLNYWYKKAK